jgi:methylmalonyl-CoA epimerase
MELGWVAGAPGVRLDHIGIAVRSLAAARGFYEALGMRCVGEEEVAGERVRVLMMALGESRVELLEATAAESVIGRFVAARGEGMHHLAFRVADVEAEFRRMRTEGVRLVGDGVRMGAGGHGYFFVHPSAAGGVLVEIVGEVR